MGFLRFRWLKDWHTLILFGLAGLLLVQLAGLLLWRAGPFGAPVQLSFVVPLDEAAAWQPLIDKFEAQNPDIRLQLVEGVYDTDQVKAIYSADLSSGNPQHDLVYMDVIWLPWFASQGWLQDLSGEFAAGDLADFLPTELAAGRYQEQLYRIPFRADVGLMLYNRSLIDQAGLKVPESFSELLSVSQTLKNRGLADWGYLWQGREYEGLVANFVEVLYGFGGFWIEPATEAVGLDQPAAIAAATFLADTIEQGISPQLVTSYGETESFNQFVAGESPFLRSWTYFWQQASQEGAPLEGQVGVAPVLAATAADARGCRGGWGFGIARNASHPEAARRAIAFFTSTTAQRDFVLNSGHLPSRSTLFQDPEVLQRYPFFPDVLRAIESYSVFRPQIPEYDQASAIVQRHLWQVLIGEVTPEMALRQAAAETRRLLSGSP